jgi:hypothetical protein
MWGVPWLPKRLWRNSEARQGACMAGPGNNPVQGFSTGLPLHWVFLRLWTGFELP